MKFGKGSPCLRGWQVDVIMMMMINMMMVMIIIMLMMTKVTLLEGVAGGRHHIHDYDVDD